MERPSRWSKYYEQNREKSPHHSLLEAIDRQQVKESALDLGAGSLRDTRYLLRSGFKKVTAVDSEPSVAEESVLDRKERLEMIISSFEDFDFPENTFDLVNAQYSLPFTSPESFNEVFTKTKASLKSGGMFVGQLFGERDGWRNAPSMTFHTLEEVHELLDDMEIINLEESEVDGKTSEGSPKHWHVFQITARKP